MKKILTLSILMLSLPAFAAEANMDHSGMDMSSMSGMDMKMDMPKAKSKVVVKPKTHPRLVSQKTPKKTKSMDMSKMDHDSMNMGKGSTDMSKMDHGSMDISKGSTDMPKMDHGSMDMSGMKMGKMQGGSAPADARSPDYSQGRDFGPIHPPMMMGNDPLMSLAVKRLEWAHRSNRNQAAYELEGWWGDDWNRAVLKAEGEIHKQSLNEAKTELLWRKPLTTFWNTELGVRQDSGYANNRTWLALGISGISPYWLDVDATFYARDQRQTALILNAEYDWRITQSWVLQPSLEVSFYGKNDLTNDIGQGLSEVRSGLRLRYDINHQFMPYVGVEMNRHYGKTADLISAKGEQPNQTFAVAGVAFWF